MDNNDNDLLLLHTLASTAFQNVTNLTPSIRQVVANAKIYQKSVQTTCSLAVHFVESLQNVANAASVSEGSTKKIGDVLSDIIDAFKEIENTKLELIQLFIDEVIIPLESKAEVEINNTKSSSKSYHHENKVQAEAVEKARSGANKYRKRSQKRKKTSPKLEEKEKRHVQRLEDEQDKMKHIRENGLRKALTDERRIYCFVAERMCAYGRGMIIYNNRISNFVSQKLPDWQQYISKPTELPVESENIIKNPSGYKMGTVKKKADKPDRKNSVKRGKSFSLHYPNKYSTYDGRTSRGGSRPSLAALTMKSNSNLSEGTPKMLHAGTPGSRRSPMLSVSHASRNGDNETQSVLTGSSSPRSLSPTPTDTSVNFFVAPTPGNNTTAPSEYANISPPHRSHSFSASNRHERNAQAFDRTNSAAVGNRSHSVASGPGDATDFASKLAHIQSQLKQKLDAPVKSPVDGEKRLKAKYDHVAEDASQLSFNKDDIIIPVCEPTSGWQYGENEKTKNSGWFPAAYMEDVIVSSTGETTVTPTTNKQLRSGSTSHRKPPPVAKKSYNTVKYRKSQGNTATIVNVQNATERRNSTGGQPALTGSSSVPQMIHMIGDADKENRSHERKHSNSLSEAVLAVQNKYSSSAEPTAEAESTPSETPTPNKEVEKTEETDSKGYVKLTNGHADNDNRPIEVNLTPDDITSAYDVIDSNDVPADITITDEVDTKEVSPPTETPKPAPSATPGSTNTGERKHKKKSYDMPPPPPPPELVNGDMQSEEVTLIAINGSSSKGSIAQKKKTFSTFGGK